MNAVFSKKACMKSITCTTNQTFWALVLYHTNCIVQYCNCRIIEEDMQYKRLESNPANRIQFIYNLFVYVYEKDGMNIIHH